MKNATRWMLACLSVVSGAAFGQYRPIALPYQLTHSVNMAPAFAPDGKRIVYISVVAGRTVVHRASGWIRSGPGHAR